MVDPADAAAVPKANIAIVPTARNIAPTTEIELVARPICPSSLLMKS
jgi:hypothetical protein